MRKIFITSPGNANYPEITAYQNYFKARGVDVMVGTISKYRALEKTNEISCCGKSWGFIRIGSNPTS
ncbi:hypothetical protein OKW31_007463 [Paraburkholderia atlantica]